MPKISGLGHVGLFANDLMAQRAFYSETLGLTIADEDLEMGIVFLSSDPVAEHHEFVLRRRREPESGVAVQQVSFKVPSLDDLRDFYHRLQDKGVKFNMIVSHGIAFGMYFDDPEETTSSCTTRPDFLCRSLAPIRSIWTHRTRSSWHRRERRFRRNADLWCFKTLSALFESCPPESLRAEERPMRLWGTKTRSFRLPLW